MAKKQTAIEQQAAADIIITKETLDAYVAKGYTADDVPALEDTVHFVHAYDHFVNAGRVEIGRRLLIIKETFAHGEWGWYIEDRLGLDWNTANKYMAAANAVNRVPELEEVIDNIPANTLYALGRGDVPQEKLQTALTRAKQFRLNGEDHRELFPREQFEAPAPPPAKSWNDYAPALSNVDGWTDYADAFIREGNAAVDTALADGVDFDKATNSNYFHEFLWRVTHTNGKFPGNDWERAVASFLVVAFAVDNTLPEDYAGPVEEADAEWVDEYPQQADDNPFA